MAAGVTQKEILDLPVGTFYSGQAMGEFEQGKEIQDGASQIMLVRTESGYTYFHPHGGQGGPDAQRVPCNDIGKSGGAGSAVVGNELPGGKPVRFEWRDLEEVQYEYWFSQSHKVGTLRNKPPQAWATLTMKDPAPSGKLLEPGSYNVRLEKGSHWAEGRFTLAADGGFQETRGSQETGDTVAREGSWKEVDGDFWLIDQKVHRYKLVSRSADGRSVELRFVPDSGPADAGHRATWIRA